MPGKLYKILFVLIVLSFQYGTAQQWKFRKEKNGIRVYTALQDSSAVRSVKAVARVHCNRHQIVALLLDIPRQPDWIYNTKQARIVEQIAANEIIFYSLVSLPWPVASRDYVSHFTITRKNDITILDSHVVPETLPHVPGVIRVEKSHAHWEIRDISDDEVEITYVLRFDPGGEVPPWLTNIFVTTGPLSTFSNLKEMVKKPEYRNAHFAFLE